jgi:hypothetical protein
MRINVPFVRSVRELIKDDDIWNEGNKARYDYLQNILNLF